MGRTIELSDFQRGTVIGCHLCKKSVREISALLELPRSTVGAVIVKWKRLGATSPLPRSGRPNKLSDRDIQVLERMASENKSSVTVLTKEFQNASGRKVSVRTVRRELHSLGFRGRPGAQKSKTVGGSAKSEKTDSKMNEDSSKDGTSSAGVEGHGNKAVQGSSKPVVLTTEAQTSSVPAVQGMAAETSSKSVVLTTDLQTSSESVIHTTVPQTLSGPIAPKILPGAGAPTMVTQTLSEPMTPTMVAQTLSAPVIPPVLAQYSCGPIVPPMVPPQSLSRPVIPTMVTQNSSESVVPPMVAQNTSGQVVQTMDRGNLSLSHSTGVHELKDLHHILMSMDSAIKAPYRPADGSLMNISSFPGTF